MAYPKFTRAVCWGNEDSEGEPLRWGRAYDFTEGARPNLVYNGGFESNEEGWTLTTGGGTVAVQAGGHSGGAALRINTTAGQIWSADVSLSYLAYMPVRLDRTYRLRLWHKAGSITGVRFVVYVTWYDSSAADISTTTAVSIENWSTDWTKTTVTALTPPALAAYARVLIRVSASEICDGWIDDVELFPEISWTDDDPTFAVTLWGQEEELTFPTDMFAPSPWGLNDPVTRLMAGSEPVEILQASQQRLHTLDFEFVELSFAQALDRWHRMTRGQSFTYTDTDKIEHTVRWAQAPSFPRIAGSTMVSFSLTLTEHL